MPRPQLAKPLRGEPAGRWSLRVGDYRVIYRIDDAARRILILVIDNRDSVYRSR